jgi:hypothetical protein
MPSNKHSTRNDAINIIKAAADKWPAPYVARSKAKEFTGGVYSSGYMANLDSQGEGPEGVFKIGRQNCYPVNRFVEWLIERIRVE